MTPRTPILASLLVVLAAVTIGAPPIGASSEVVDIDTDHHLTSQEAIQTYHAEGVATATDVGGHDFTISIARDHQAVNLSGFHFDTRYTYLHVNYGEDIPRTYRLYIPREYFRPRVQEDLDAARSPLTVDLHPTDDHEWTVVTIRFDGPTEATFKLAKSPGLVFTSRSWVGEKVNNTTGVDVPSLGTSRASSDWQYIDRTRLAGNNTTVPIQTEGDAVTIQMDVSSTTEESRWVAVPRCTRNMDSVCWFQKDGVPNEIYVMSTVDDPPQVRYKAGTDRTAGVSGAIEDIRQGIRKTLDDIGGWLGGGD